MRHTLPPHARARRSLSFVACAIATLLAGIAAPLPIAHAGEHYKPRDVDVVVNGAVPVAKGGFVAARPAAFGITPPIRDLATAAPARPHDPKDPAERNENPRVKYPRRGFGADKGDGRFVDPLLAQAARAPRALEAMPSPTLTFLGETAGETGGYVPPDTNGDVGPNHYVQATNVRVSVYDKSGARVLPASLQSTTFFTGLPAGDACRIGDDGDPVVLYDPLADRWLVSQFEIDDVPGHQCVAISATPDPLGAYYAYDFVMPNANVHDYPHYGVWTDAYYLTTNQFDTSFTTFLGAGVFALDRKKMLAGDPTAGYVFKDLYTVDPTAGGLLPSDLDGLTPPPAGLPNRLMEFRADEHGDPTDAIRTYELVPDFADPAASTFTVRSDVPLAPFDARAPDTINVMEQTAGVAVDAIADRLMFRLGYRNLGTVAAPVNSWVGNFTVNVSGVAPTDAASYQGGIRWFELRSADASTLESVRDQGTHNLAPGNGASGLNDWMGSIAQDAQGNLAVGFSQSGTTKNADIVIAGRTGTATGVGLNAGEAIFFASGGAQSDASGRWGDYSAMSVDPVDDCTFWYTQEYYAAASVRSWNTRIGKFALPGCTTPARGTIAASITDCGTGNPLPGVTLAVSGGFSRVTTATGALDSNIVLAPGTYAVTASRNGYTTQGSASFAVSTGATSVFSACLAGIPNLVAATPVTLAAEAFPPANGAPDPGETVTVNLPVANTGLANTASLTATLAANAGVTLPGAPQSYGVVTAGGPSVSRPFTFTAAGACGSTIDVHLDLVDGATSLGSVSYPLRLGTLVTGALASEAFDAVAAPALPAGWATTATGGDAEWITSAQAPVSAPNSAYTTNAASLGTTELVSPVIDVPAGGGTLTFKNVFNMESAPADPTLGYDGMVLEVSVNGSAYADITTGGNAFTAGGYTSTISSNYASALAGRRAWSGLSGGTTSAPAAITSSIALPPAAAGQPIRLKWRVASDSNSTAPGAAGVRIDDIVITGSTPTCVARPNTAPSVSNPGSQSILEDAAFGPADVAVGDAETALGNLALTATSSNHALVPDANVELGGSDANRTVRVTPLPNASGTATITLTVTDGGGLTDAVSFDVVVAPVNDAPAFTVQGDRVETPGASGARSIPGFVTSVLLGALEADQTVLGYGVVEIDDPAGIVSGAAIANDGTLAYTLSGASGTATLRAVLEDSGGTANGGVDTSAPVDFTIATVPVALFKDGFE